MSVFAHAGDLAFLHTEEELEQANVIVSAALAVERLRLQALAAKAERAKHYCERAEPHGDMHSQGIPGDATGKSPTQDEPCWKTNIWIAADDAERLARELWCETCLSRDRVHERYIRLTRELGGKRGRLTKMLRKRLAEENEEGRNAT